MAEKTQTIGELRAKAQKDPDSLTPSEVKTLNDLRKMSPQGAERWLVTRQEAAELCNCTVDNIDKMLSKGILPRAGRGKIDLREICRHLREGRDGRRGDSDELRQAQVRYREAKAKLSEIEVAIKEGRLIARDDIARAMMAAGVTFRNSLQEWSLILPDRLTKKGKKFIRQTLRDEIDRVLTELSEQLEDVDGRPSQNT